MCCIGIFHSCLIAAVFPWYFHVAELKQYSSANLPWSSCLLGHLWGQPAPSPSRGQGEAGLELVQHCHSYPQCWSGSWEVGLPPLLPASFLCCHAGLLPPLPPLHCRNWPSPWPRADWGYPGMPALVCPIQATCHQWGSSSALRHCQPHPVPWSVIAFLLPRGYLVSPSANKNGGRGAISGEPANKVSMKCCDIPWCHWDYKLKAWHKKPLCV